MNLPKGGTQTMSRVWYYTGISGETGPISASELKSLAASGKVTAKTLVRNNSMSHSVPASEVKGLEFYASLLSDYEAADLLDDILPVGPSPLTPLPDSNPDITEAEVISSPPVSGPETLPTVAEKGIERETKSCPYCREDILATAIKCKHCGEMLEGRSPSPHISPPSSEWNPGVAAVLNLVIPGSGFLYMGRIGEGMVTIIGLPVLYLICWGLAVRFLQSPAVASQVVAGGVEWVSKICMGVLFFIPVALQLLQVVNPFRIAEEEQGKNSELD